MDHVNYSVTNKSYVSKLKSRMSKSNRLKIWHSRSSHRPLKYICQSDKLFLFKLYVEIVADATEGV